MWFNHRSKLVAITDPRLVSSHHFHQHAIGCPNNNRFYETERIVSTEQNEKLEHQNCPIHHYPIKQITDETAAEFNQVVCQTRRRLPIYQDASQFQQIINERKGNCEIYYFNISIPIKSDYI